MPPQNIVDLLSRGTKTAPASVGVTNAVGGQTLLAANPNRKVAIIVNTSVNIVYLGKDATVTVANGVPLAAGASFRDDFSNDAWQAIAAVAGPSAVVSFETQ